MEEYISWLIIQFEVWCLELTNKNKKDTFNIFYKNIYNTIYNSNLSSIKKTDYFNKLKDIKRWY